MSHHSDRPRRHNKAPLFAFPPDPTSVSLRKFRTASVALSSPNTFLTDGALGCFYPHASPTSFHILRLWAAHAALGDQAPHGCTRSARKMPILTSRASVKLTPCAAVDPLRPAVAAFGAACLRAEGNPAESLPVPHPITISASAEEHSLTFPMIRESPV